MRSHEACRLFKYCVVERHESAWELFFRRYDRRVRRAVLRSWKRRSAGAQRFGLEYEELLQEVYCQLLGEGSSTFEGEHNEQLWGWIERISEHLICDLWRHQRALKRCPPAISETPVELCSGEGPGQATTSPEQQLLAKESFGNLLRRCREVMLGVHERWVVHLVRWAFLEGCTSHEISLASGEVLSPQEVDRLLQRLRRGLALHGMKLPRRGSGGRQAPWVPPRGAILGHPTC